LREAREIPFEVHGLSGQGHGQVMPAGLDHGATGLKGPLDDHRELDGRLLQRDLASGDPRDIEEIIDEAGELPHLAIDRRARPLEPRVLELQPLQHLHRIADGCQGVAQLVGQHRQELVLVSVRLPECLFGPAALGDLCLQAFIARQELGRAFRDALLQ
jgi:hypothetical protein